MYSTTFLLSISHLACAADTINRQNTAVDCVNPVMDIIEMIPVTYIKAKGLFFFSAT